MTTPVWLSLPGGVTLDATRVIAVRDVGENHTLVYLDSGAAVPVVAPRQLVLDAVNTITKPAEEDPNT